MSKVRISKKLLAQQYPQAVVNQINAIANRYHIKSFNADIVTSNKEFYVGEGESFTGIKADGTSASFEVVSANNIGASGLSHKIGERFSMPAGTYLINVYYYTKYFMTVYTVSPEALPELAV